MSSFKDENKKLKRKIRKLKKAEERMHLYDSDRSYSKRDNEIRSSELYKQLREKHTKLKQENTTLNERNNKLGFEHVRLKRRSSKTAGRKPNSERLKQKYDEVMRLKAEGKTQSEI